MASHFITHPFYQKTAQAERPEREYGGAYLPSFPRTTKSRKRWGSLGSRRGLGRPTSKTKQVQCLVTSLRSAYTRSGRATARAVGKRARVEDFFFASITACWDNVLPYGQT